MYVELSGVAVIMHGDTREGHRVRETDGTWEDEVTNERRRGDERVHAFVVDHKQLGLLRWEIVEYPFGEISEISHSIGNHRVLGDFGYHLIPDGEDDVEMLEEVDEAERDQANSRHR
jgi:hypothetical protein